jgi:hypothetical protein
MNPADFNNGAATSSGRTCVGAVFELASNGGVDQWIFGDAFRKLILHPFLSFGRKLILLRERAW